MREYSTKVIWESGTQGRVKSKYKCFEAGKCWGIEVERAKGRVVEDLTREARECKSCRTL